jgi:hypothetical protein
MIDRERARKGLKERGRAQGRTRVYNVKYCSMSVRGFIRAREVVSVGVREDKRVIEWV